MWKSNVYRSERYNKELERRCTLNSLKTTHLCLFSD